MIRHVLIVLSLAVIGVVVVAAQAPAREAVRGHHSESAGHRTVADHGRYRGDRLRVAPLSRVCRELVPGLGCGLRE